jgi:hypothetical protein
MRPCRAFSGSHVFDDSRSDLFRLNCPGNKAVSPLILYENEGPSCPELICPQEERRIEQYRLQLQR